MNSNMLCNISCTIREAWNNINDNLKRMVIVVDDEGKLQGTVSDGDIRRGILNGLSINDPILKVIHRDCTYVKSGTDFSDINSKFYGKFLALPIVDENMVVVDVIVGSDRLAIMQPALSDKEFLYLTDAFLSTWISSSGKYIPEFEDKFSSYCGVKYGVATSNGTSALHLALMALGIGPGDEVIVPDITFAATINSVIYTGAAPVIVDIEEDGWCMDPKRMEEAITGKTKAVIPVHIYGQPCDMSKIMKIAREHGLYVVEDCAEAHGAESGGKKVGSFGDISCFSFFGNKVITTGEGGMCITDSEDLSERMRLLRDHGMSKTKKYYHEVIGYNYRMTNLQAAIGVAQLEQIDEILVKRADLEDEYRKRLSGINGLHFQRNDLPERKKITWLITAYLEDASLREKLFDEMKKELIDVRPFFIPLSRMGIYEKYCAKDTPFSSYFSERGFNIPTANSLDEEAINRVERVIKKVLG